jgi:hypothetical protein
MGPPDRRPAIVVAACVCLWIATCLAIPSAASAAIVHFGSNLSHPATVSEQSPVDTTWWQALLAPFSAVSSSGSEATVPVAPADGQIVEVTVRGHVGSPSADAAPYPPQPVNFQDLRPRPDGSVQVITTSQAFMLPNADGVYSYLPTDLCVYAGDFIGLSDRGGFDAQTAPNGIPFEVFAPVNGSTTNRFSAHAGVLNGAVLQPTALPGVELLMQMVLATGADASALCRGGNAGPVGSVPGQTDHVTGGTVPVTVACKSTFPCQGTASLVFPYTGAHGARAAAPVRLGKANVLIPALKTQRIKVRLTGRGRRLLRSHHRRLRCGLRVVLTSGPSQTKTTGLVKLHGG